MEGLPPSVKGFLDVGQNPCFLLHWHLLPQMRKRDPLTPILKAKGGNVHSFSKALKFGICQFVRLRVLWNDNTLQHRHQCPAFLFNWVIGGCEDQTEKVFLKLS